MEDKTFALLEKLYIELLDTKKQMNEAKDESNRRFDKLEGQMSVMGGQLTDAKDESNHRFDKLEGQLTVIEHEHGMKLDAALDGYRLVFEKLQEHDLRFDSLEEKIKTQELEVRVIKGSKGIAG